MIIQQEVLAKSKRLGVLCLPGRGHLYPATALGQALQRRGYDVTFFNRNITRALVRASGLSFCPLDEHPAHSVVVPQWASDHPTGPNTLEVIQRHCRLTFEQGPSSISNKKIEALLVDQADLGGGTVADYLQIPFINISLIPPVYLDDESPPFIFHWMPSEEGNQRRRNGRGNRFFQSILAPILETVNAQREAWGLRARRSVNELFSDRAIITQLPKLLDFPRSNSPAALYYTGPFDTDMVPTRHEFPWHLLNGKLVLFASMGTVRNSDRRIFEIIAEACAHFDVQLIISLGGMTLSPDKLSDLCGDPIVVHYAPQKELLKLAHVAILHGGINSTLEALSRGVPIIAVPITDDQPGVAARIKWLGVGVSLPIKQLSPSSLRACLCEILYNNKYRRAAQQIQDHLAEFNGVTQAVAIIDKCLLNG